MVRPGSYAAVNLTLVSLILMKAPSCGCPCLPCGYVLLVLSTVQKLFFLKLREDVNVYVVFYVTTT